MTTCSDGSLVTEDTPRDMGPAGRDGVSDETDSWTPVCSQRKKKRKEKRKKEATTNFLNKREISLFIIWLARGQFNKETTSAVFYNCAECACKFSTCN